MMNDGSEGMRTIKRVGGITIVEDPATAEFKGMPNAAVATGCIDYTLSLEDIGRILNKLCTG